MDKELLRRLAQECGAPGQYDPDARMYALTENDIRRLAALIAEECAKVCDNVGKHYTHDHERGARACSQQVRATFSLPVAR